MSSPPAPPDFPQHENLAKWCFNTTAVRDFLRLSRSTVDDSISAHLNSLLTPSRFNPFASSSTQPSPTRGDRRNVPDDTCTAFKQKVLFPGWSTRDSVLASCSAVADASDAQHPRSDPEADSAKSSSTKNYWGHEQPVDERLDPYSARNYDWTRTSPAQQLREVLQNEARTESIVRSRTWSVLGERCISGAAGNAPSTTSAEEQWRQEYQDWAQRRAGI